MASNFFEASNKRFNETVVLVPFYGAKAHQLNRHIQFLNGSGFDVLRVDLDFRIDLLHPPISSKMQFGYKHIWADQIEEALNSISGAKIVYSFSNPSASAIEAISRRHAHDISALICDSGPSKHAFKSILRLSTQENPLPLFPFSLAKSLVGTAVIAPNFAKELESDLSTFPSELPILSIRGWKDRITPASYIDDVFDPHPHLTWQKLSLPEAEHLNGLRDFPDEYQPGVLRFLNAHATGLGN